MARSRRRRSESGTVVICGGELKAVAASAVLNQHDIGAISGTGSESTLFVDTQIKEFNEKVVYVLYDIDETGVFNAVRLCNKLYKFASKIYNVKLPLNIEEYPHGDVNDFLRIGGNLLELIQNTTEEWIFTPETLPTAVNDKDEVHEITLDDAVTASFARKRVKIDAVIILAKILNLM